MILMRDGAAGPEVFLLRRVAAMAFAGGMTVFPGGGVDRRDTQLMPGWAGPEPGWWAEAFGCPVPLAQALVCAAVRETFEESGVLLAGADPASVVTDPAVYGPQRAALVAKEISLAHFLESNSLVLRADLLAPWSNWITPVQEPRRYDTRFLLAELPGGQQADGATSEADAAEWRRPDDALREWRAGERGLLPPTWTTLTELAEAGSVSGALTLARARRIEPITPWLVRDGDRVRVVLPGDPLYGRTA